MAKHLVTKDPSYDIAQSTKKQLDAKVKKPKPRPDRKLTDKQMGELVEHLRGTTGDQEEALKAVAPELTWDDLTEADLFEFDMSVFLCAICGWWCGTDEESEEEHSSGEQVCQECYDES